MLEAKTIEIRKSPGNDAQLLVSICCLTYNHEKYIGDTIDGFLKQEVGFGVEILIHDDASTDGTRTIIEDYQSRYPHLIKPIFQTQNQYSQGVSPNRAFNFSRARGKYIAMCEGDDYWRDASHLRSKVCFLEENPAYVICYSGAEAYRDGKLVEIVSGAERDLSSDELMRAHPINTCTSVFRNIPLEFTSALKLAPLGDLVLWSQLGNFGKGKYLASSPPCFYRIHAGGVFSDKTSREKNRMGLLTFVALYLYYLEVHNRDLVTYFGMRVASAVTREIGLLETAIELIKKGLKYAVFLIARGTRAQK